jgi:hypothetical protein
MRTLCLSLFSALSLGLVACDDSTSPASAQPDAIVGSDVTTPPAEDTATPPAEDATTPPAEDTATAPEDTAPPAEDTAPPAEDTATAPEDTAPPEEDTATPPEDTTPSRGACDNAEDLPRFTDAATIEGHVSACVTQCLTSGQLNATCYSGCMQTRAGFSAGCSACFGEVMQCTVANCALQCIDASSAGCTTCRDTKCTPAFETCAGVSNPG